MCRRKRIGKVFERVIAKSPVHAMNAKGITDPVCWTLDQLKTRLPLMVAEAEYDDSDRNVD